MFCVGSQQYTTRNIERLANADTTFSAERVASLSATTIEKENTSSVCCRSRVSRRRRSISGRLYVHVQTQMWGGCPTPKAAELREFGSASPDTLMLYSRKPPSLLAPNQTYAGDGIKT